MAGMQRSLLVSTVLRQGLCTQCQLLNRTVTPAVWIGTRGSRNWKRKVVRREDIKEKVVEYVGQNPRRADRVYAWGCATTGALGIGSYMRPEKNQRPIAQQCRPARVKFFDSNHIRPYAVSCGYGFTVYAVRSARGLQLMGTGINTSSQLGYHEVPRNSGRVLDYVIEPVTMVLPVDRPSSTRVRHIGCGRAHTIVVSDGAGVFSLGSNAYGQCGRPIVEGEDFRKNPLVHTVQDLPDDLTQVSCGQDHTIFSTASGELFACGLGADGQTGQGHYDKISTPSRVGGDIMGEKIIQVHGRGDCVLAVSEKGEVFGWGNSEYSQLSMVTGKTQLSMPTRLPLPPTCGKVIKAVAGGSICGLLNDKGQVFVWGYGILGKGPELGMSEKPTMIPETLFGRNELQPDSCVVDIDCGLGHFTAVTNTGDVYSWGHNRQGCLGLGFRDNQFFPLKVSVPAETYTVVCGVDHVIALCKSFT